MRTIAFGQSLAAGRAAPRQRGSAARRAADLRQPRGGGGRGDRGARGQGQGGADRGLRARESRTWS